MQLFDIWLAEHDFKECPDCRPWLIIELPGTDHIACFPLSTQCYDGHCFPLVPEDEDFQATGLGKLSYIHDETIYELPNSAFVKRLGRLSGALLQQFRRSSGV